MDLLAPYKALVREILDINRALAAIETEIDNGITKDTAKVLVARCEHLERRRGRLQSQVIGLMMRGPGGGVS
jgi:hypothetical protein